MVIAQLVSNFTMYLNPPGQKITLTCHACLRIFRQGWEWYHKLLKLRGMTYLTEWRFDNPWYHVKIKFNNYFIIHFLNNLHKKTPLSKFAKLWEHNTDKGLGDKADFEVDMINTTSTTYLAKLSCQLHTLLYID